MGSQCGVRSFGPFCRLDVIDMPHACTGGKCESGDRWKDRETERKWLEKPVSNKADSSPFHHSPNKPVDNDANMVAHQVACHANAWKNDWGTIHCTSVDKTSNQSAVFAYAYHGLFNSKSSDMCLFPLQVLSSRISTCRCATSWLNSKHQSVHILGTNSLVQKINHRSYVVVVVKSMNSAILKE
ncbi:hypothetical protein BDF19DRAFT_237699 [Syncephalis fuscata]|nr:hypothetical protein BDF19DRAFT_237699 [Syncephalis fuscata]